MYPSICLYAEFLKLLTTDNLSIMKIIPVLAENETSCWFVSLIIHTLVLCWLISPMLISSFLYLLSLTFYFIVLQIGISTDNSATNTYTIWFDRTIINKPSVVRKRKANVRRGWKCKLRHFPDLSLWKTCATTFSIDHHDRTNWHWQS